VNSNSENINFLERMAEEKNAFETMFRENWDMVYSISFAMTKSKTMAEDIAQDVFLSLWENRQKFSEVQNVNAFFITVTKFTVLKRLRRIKVEEAFKQYQAYRSFLNIEFSNQEDMLMLKHINNSIQKGISELPPQQQRVFKLSREQGLSHEEIGETIGVSKKTVKDYIVRSLAFLRQRLQSDSLIFIALMFSVS
jgi:RNA polymerase sigma-70 factor (family 1)